MSKPTPNTPPERPNESPSNKQDGTVEERVDTTLPDAQPVVDEGGRHVSNASDQCLADQWQQQTASI